MSAPYYYRLESCCTGEILYFQPPIANNSPIYGWTLPQQLLYNSFDQYGLVSGQCYLVTTVVGNGAAYPYLGSSWFSLTGPGFTDCSVLFGECAECDPCYLLVSCDGSIPPFTTTQDLSAYVGQSVVLQGTDLPATCYQVALSPNASLFCNSTTETLSYVEDCECPCNCYNIIANSKDCLYIDCDGNVQNTGPLTGTLEQISCSSTYPAVIGNEFPSPINIVNIGPCVNGNCPDECYELVDCDGIQDPIVTNKLSLGLYAILGQIVKIENYPDTCWIVNSTANCDCAIDVVVVQAYDDCPTCKNPSKYKLTNCDDPNTIVYTSSDLSPFVGQVILRGDCPGCWYIEEIQDIPSDTIVTVTAAYTDCIACAREYYKLVDCTGFKDPIITYTDLSQYIGSVIKIKYCPETCWTVQQTNDPTNAGIVFPEIEYVDCPECLLTFPCICTTVRNDSTTSKDYRYYDCNLDIQFFTLAPGEKSERFCIRAWAIYFPETDYIETYGSCTEDTQQDTWSCPPVIYPRRSVQPGYNTPACTIEKYEKISCKSAEVYYKQVLYLRYGISDCCPEDTDKWLIKKELIDLDALRDPNYICTSINPCCPSTPSCGYAPCNCGTPTTTCNSQ
jgi:hypothetical protein